MPSPFGRFTILAGQDALPTPVTVVIPDGEADVWSCRDFELYNNRLDVLRDNLNAVVARLNEIDGNIRLRTENSAEWLSYAEPTRISDEAMEEAYHDRDELLSLPNRSGAIQLQIDRIDARIDNLSHQRQLLTAEKYAFVRTLEYRTSANPRIAQEWEERDRLEGRRHRIETESADLMRRIQNREPFEEICE